MAFIDEIKARAKADKKTIVLPETERRKNLPGCRGSFKRGDCDLILVGSKEEIEKERSRI